MLLERRDFLKLIGAAAAAAALDPLVVIAPADDLYTNDRLGVSFRRPDGWHFISTIDFEAARQNHVFDNLTPELQELFADGFPSAIIAKYPFEHDDLNPYIAFWDEPADPLDTESEEEYHGYALRCIARLLRDYAVVDPPSTHIVNGASSTRSRSRFTYVHQSGRTWPVAVTTLLFFRSERAHTFHFIRHERYDAVVERQLSEAMQSIRYLHAR